MTLSQVLEKSKIHFNFTMRVVHAIQGACLTYDRLSGTHARDAASMPRLRQVFPIPRARQGALRLGPSQPEALGL